VVPSHTGAQREGSGYRRRRFHWMRLVRALGRGRDRVVRCWITYTEATGLCFGKHGGNRVHFDQEGIRVHHSTVREAVRGVRHVSITWRLRAAYFRFGVSDIDYSFTTNVIELQCPPGLHAMGGGTCSTSSREA